MMEAVPRLLVVDDAPEILMSVARFARQFGFDVTTGAGGADTLARLPSFRPDVVMVDLQMSRVG
jgi:CheY-like chemotaxis protein